MIKYECKKEWEVFVCKLRRVFWEDLINVCLYKKCCQSRYIKGDNCKIFVRSQRKKPEEPVLRLYHP